MSAKEKVSPIEKNSKAVHVWGYFSSRELRSLKMLLKNTAMNGMKTSN